jgi:hypothetical protein
VTCSRSSGSSRVEGRAIEEDNLAMPRKRKNVEQRVSEPQAKTFQ